jgi:radical SAM superfamily enzyme YgiQ (UPF0313 family)
MERFDVIFLHAPKGSRPHRSSWIDLFPMGLLGLADLLWRHGISTQIVHLGIEWAADRTFSILSYLKEKSPRIIALDLHWHDQSFNVIEEAGKIKTALPHTYVLFGGLTASFFHEEIMKSSSEVDGIIRGEAEGPLLELASAILEGKEDLFSIRNLTWRRKGKILINPLSYVASQKDLNGLCFTNFSLLKNSTAYTRFLSPRSRSSFFPLPVGRGCPVQCTWCSGGILAQRTISGRKDVVFRETEGVLRTIREALSHGYETFSICFDPYPHSPDYYLQLFSRIREEKLQMECVFESFGLPTTDFIQSFKKTFSGPRSRIVLSPEVGSDQVRGIHKGYPYTTQALLESLDRLNDHDVLCNLSFASGVPFEGEEEISRTVRLQKEIRRRYPKVTEIRNVSLDIEPGSPWHLDPEAYGVKTTLKSFMDYYHHHSQKDETSAGYWIPDYLSRVKDEKEFKEVLREIRDRYLPDTLSNTGKPSIPIWGMRFSDVTRVLKEIGNLFGIRKRVGFK